MITGKERICIFGFARTAAGAERVDHYRCLNSQAKFKAIFITTKPKKKTWSVRMADKIDTEEGRDMYARRMGIVEPVFAHIVYHKKLNRFTLRGRAKVKI